MKNTIKIKVDHYGDRGELANILLRQGYKVWIEEKKKDMLYSDEDYVVCFEK